MKELIEYIARSLVEKPDEVRVEEEQQRGRVVLHLYVAEDDYGRVIGRNGRIAQGLRALLKVAAVRNRAYASLEIGD